MQSVCLGSQSQGGYGDGYGGLGPQDSLVIWEHGPHLWLLLADDSDLTPLGRKLLQAEGQVANLVLPQHQDHVLGPAADGVLGLVQGDVLYGAGGRGSVHLGLVEALGWLVGSLLHREELACGMPEMQLSDGYRCLWLLQTQRVRPGMGVGSGTGW